MNKYKCEHCGKFHDYYKSFPLVTVPQVISDLSLVEKEKLKKLYDSFYHLEDSYFICKGDLFIYVKGLDWYVHWEVWLKIEESEFYSLPEDLERNVNYHIKAEVVSPILYYDMALNSTVTAIFNFEDVNGYPEIVPADTSSELGKDFLEGIPETKIKRWMKNIYH